MPLSRQADNPRTPKFQCCAAQRPLQTWSRAGMDHFLMSLQVCGDLRLLNIEIGGAGGYPRAARWQFNFPLRSCSGPSRCAERRRNTCTDDCDNTVTWPCKCATCGASSDNTTVRLPTMRRRAPAASIAAERKRGNSTQRERTSAWNLRRQGEKKGGSNPAPH